MWVFYGSGRNHYYYAQGWKTIFFFFSQIPSVIFFKYFCKMILNAMFIIDLFGGRKDFQIEYATKTSAYTNRKMFHYYINIVLKM